MAIHIPYGAGRDIQIYRPYYHCGIWDGGFFSMYVGINTIQRSGSQSSVGMGVPENALY